MLSSQHRLNKKQDIERVFKHGQTFYINDLGLRFVDTDPAKSRFTIVVSLKVSKKAVTRNLLKRRLREIIRRDILPRLRQNVDGLILTKQSLLKLPFADLKQLTIKLFKKARLI